MGALAVVYAKQASFCRLIYHESLLRSVPTTPDPNTSAEASWYKWEAYRNTNWCVYAIFCQKKGILLLKYRDRNGRCIAILFKSIGSGVDVTLLIFIMPCKDRQTTAKSEGCLGYLAVSRRHRHQQWLNLNKDCEVHAPLEGPKTKNY